jgi:hypothetical protein
MDEEIRWWSEAMKGAYVAWLGAALLCNLAAVVTVATVVRRHRPDAYQGLLTWSIAAFVAGSAWPIFSWVWVRTISMSDVRAILRAEAISTIVGIPLMVLSFLLLMYGLVRLAQPPKPVVTEAVGPYR